VAGGADAVIALRRATPADADWLVDLYTDDDVDPFLRPGSRDRDSMLEDIARSQEEPVRRGVMVIEADGERAGAMEYHCLNEPNRIAHLGGLAVHRSFRGRRLADDAARLLQRYLLLELDYHRLELACYGFNERAIAHAERSGYVREGVKRKAYLRHGEWQDAVLFSLLREDLEAADGRAR
jgi:RimJ/RimL family protein N-acetyltransferase